MSMTMISHRNNNNNSYTNNSRCNTMETRITMKLTSQWITKRVKMRRWMRKLTGCRPKRPSSIIILNASNKRPT